MTTHRFVLVVSQENPGAHSPRGQKKKSRRLIVEASGKEPIRSSAAKPFHGDDSRWNPEELFLAALAECHLLSFVYVAERDGLSIHSCEVEARAELEVNPDGSGRITRVELFPETLAPGVDEAKVLRAHREAESLCFIAASVSCEVIVRPKVLGGSASDTQG